MLTTQASEQRMEVVRRVLATAREQLGMEVALVSELVDGRQVFRIVDGDATSFNATPGSGTPAEGTYCRRVIDGRVPNVIRDAKGDDLVCRLPITLANDIGSYIGVPVRFPDGRLYGTLCCMSHSSRPDLRDRDAQFLRTLAELIGHQLAATADEVRFAEKSRRVWNRLDPGGIEPVFQPVVDLSAGMTAGYEALARFPGGEEVPPDVWFADAWEVGMGVDLEVAAARQALATLDGIPSPAYVAVNLSPTAILSRRFENVLASAPRERVVIEVTEHERVDDYAVLRTALDLLREEGVRIAMDDTGAGFAGLQHLVSLGAEIIKLDRAIIEHVEHDPASRALVSSMAAFAGETGASLLAEGIETPGQLEALRLLGVGYGQGYLLGRPAPFSMRLDAVQSA